MIEFKDDDELLEYISKQIRMGNFDWEVEDRFDYLNVYNDFYFPDESSFMEVVKYDIAHGEHDDLVAKRAEKLDIFPIPPTVDAQRQAEHRGIHSDGVWHWSHCARCLERYK